MTLDEFQKAQFYVCQDCGVITTKTVKLPFKIFMIKDSFGSHVFKHPRVCINCAKKVIEQTRLFITDEVVLESCIKEIEEQY